MEFIFNSKYFIQNAKNKSNCELKAVESNLEYQWVNYSLYQKSGYEELRNIIL